MAKQRDDGEPIGQCAYHRRFRKSDDYRPCCVLMFIQTRDNIKSRGSHEQQRGYPFDATERPLPILVKSVVWHIGSREDGTGV